MKKKFILKYKFYYVILSFISGILNLMNCDVMAQLSSGVIYSWRNTLLDIRTRGEMKVGVSPEYIPFEFKDASGELVGFDIDIANKIAEALNVKVTFREVEFSKLLSLLEKQEIDIIISGMTRTLDRALSVNFTEPYFQTGQVIILNSENKHARTLSEIDLPKNKIGVVKSTTGQKLARTKLQKAKLIEFDNETLAMQSLLWKEVDGFIFDKPFADVFKLKEPAIIVLPEQLSFEFYCMAIDYSDLHFLLWLNYFLEEIKLSGEYDLIYKKWFTASEKK